MTKNKSPLSGIGIMALLTFISKLVKLLVLMVTARFLTPEDFGVVAAFSMVLALAYLITDIGLTKTLIQRPIINKFHIGSATVVSLLFAFIVTVILAFSSGSIEELTGVPGVKVPLQVSSVLFILFAISNICAALFQRDGKVVLIGKIQSFCTIFGSVCVTIPLLWFDFGYWSIIIGIIVAEFMSLIVIAWLGRTLLSISIAKKEIKEILKYTSAFFSHNLIRLISKQVDSAIIGRYLGSTALGNYSRSIQLIEFPNQIYWLVVDRVVFPSMSAMKSDKERLCSFFTDAYSLLMLPLSIGAIILFLGAEEIIGIMMGDGWTTVVILLEILSINVVLKCITGFIDSFLAAYGEIRSLTYKNICSLVIFIFSIIFGLQYGITGVAYAVVVSSLINMLLSMLITVCGAKVPLKGILHASIPAVLTSLASILLYILISYLISAPGLVNILISIIFLSVFCVLFPSELLLSKPLKTFILKWKSSYFHGDKNDSKQ